MENKPTSLLVVPFGKAFNGISHLGVVDRLPANRNVRPSTFGCFLALCNKIADLLPIFRLLNKIALIFQGLGS